MKNLFSKETTILFMLGIVIMVFMIVSALSRHFYLSLVLSLIIFYLLHLYYRYRITKLELYEKIYKTVSYLSRYTELKSLLDFVVHSITEILNADRTSLFLLNKETNTLWTLIAEELEIREFSLPVGKGIAGLVALTGEVINIKDDPYKDKRFLPIIDLKTGYRTKTLLAAPIYDTKNKIIGVIEVLNKKGNIGFSNQDTDILKVFCSEVGSVLTNTQLYENLQQLLESLFKAFATAVDARDPATRGHSLRTMKYALNIAQEMKLSAQEIKILEYSAILHDVGKIGIPDSILLKAEQFTKEEYEIMKSHALLTKEILSKIYFPEEFKDVPFIATTHHEFVDGSGYPYGLKNEQIPLLARILCIADIYDALISYDRPYKPPYSQEEALKIMAQMADDGKLDKNILDLFATKKLYQIERRKYVRIDGEFSFAWRKLGPEDIKSVLPFITKTKNVSAGGLQFYTNEEVPVNTFIEVELYLPNYTIETLAKVVRCTSIDNQQQFEIGITFINLPKETEKRLNKYLIVNLAPVDQPLVV